MTTKTVNINIYIWNEVIYDKAIILVAVRFSLQNTAIICFKPCIWVGLCERLLVIFFIYIHFFFLMFVMYLYAIKHEKSEAGLFQDLR